MSDLESLKLPETPTEGAADEAAPGVRKANRNLGKRPVRKSMSPFANQPKRTEAQKPARVTARNKPGRKPKDEKRVPLGKRQGQLGYATREGYVRRWVTDKGSRIQAAIGGGYDFVTENDGTRVARPVGSQEGGRGLTAYLMEIPDEFYSDDFWEKQAKIDETDEQIMNGTLNLQPGDLRYVPKDAISIRTRVGPGK